MTYDEIRYLLHRGVSRETVLATEVFGRIQSLVIRSQRKVYQAEEDNHNGNVESLVDFKIKDILDLLTR